MFGSPPLKSAAQQTISNMPTQYLNLANRGGMSTSVTPQSQYGVGLLNQASRQQDTLTPMASSVAQQFLQGPQQNPYLQNSLDAQQKRTTQLLTPQVQSSFAQAGRGGSLDERGTIADRVSSAMAPVNAQALASDFDRQQQLQYNTMMHAGDIAGQGGNNLAQRAGYAQQSGNQQNINELNDLNNLNRQSTALQSVTPVYNSQKSGGFAPIVAGGIGGFAKGGWPGAFAGAGMAMMNQKAKS